MSPGQAYGVLCAPGQGPRTVHFPKPNWRVGDARYLKPNSTKRLELRPLLIEEMVAGCTYTPGTWMLIIRGRSGVKVRASVLLPRHLRKNTQQNAKLALEIQLQRCPDLHRLIQIVDMAVPGMVSGLA